MRMTDLKKGTIYAWKHGYDSDVRELRNFVKVEYVGPAVARYDKYRPDRKLNKGMISVKLLEEHRLPRRWNSGPLEGIARDLASLPIGAVHEIESKALLMPWDDMVVLAGDKYSAGLALIGYLKELKALMKEVDPKILIDDQEVSWREGRREKQMIEVILHTFDEGSKFDPADSSNYVRMPAELFRKLMMGMRV